MKKEELIKKQIPLLEELNKIDKLIEETNYEERYANAKQYEGRYFKELHNHDKKSILCLYVYATDKIKCEPMALAVSYWTNNDISYFNIDFYSHFYPKYWEEEEKWEEISKEEFISHYNEVQKRITNIINK